ncbi:MAG: hypothetical protein J1F71_00640 [Clostridiales bacterium]|nr:hypothetical protein [Clostridiales bacterium]
MKKRLLTLLSLVMAFVLCFAFVACSGGNKKSSGGKKPAGGKDDDEGGNGGKLISVSLNELLGSAADVLDAAGFTGSASYTLSTKNTQKVSESIALDKRGNKLMVGDMILDFDTGYTYVSTEDGYHFYEYPFGGALDQVRGMLALIGDDAADEKLAATYYEDEGKTVLTIDVAEDVNKYFTPLYSAYKNNKTINVLLNDYCDLLFGVSFDDIYSAIEDFIKDEENTVGVVADFLGATFDVDLFELMGEYMPLEDDLVNMIKERKLSEVFVGAYDYLMTLIADMLPEFGTATAAELEGNDGSDQDYSESDQMMEILMGALSAMFFEEVDTTDLEDKLASVKSMLDIALLYGTRAAVDMVLADRADLADLYNAIKSAVVFDELSVTVSLTESNDVLTGIKIDCFASHTYTGAASAGSILADNDYLASVELKITEYKTAPSDFDITFDHDFEYRRNVTVFLYALTDTDLHVYYETAGNEMSYNGIALFDNYYNPIDDAPNNAVMFSDSSFVFNSAFLKSYFEGAAVGTDLIVEVYSADGAQFNVMVTYMEGDPLEVLQYAMGKVGSMMGFLFGGSGGDIGFEEYPSEY